jgi:hypothetical protein
MTTSLVIVDDALQNPDALREIALKQDYPAPAEPTHFPGRNSREAQVIPGIEQMMSGLAGLPLKAAADGGAFGKFRVALDGDKGVSGVHIDNADYTAIIYLTLPEHCQDGTHFFKHLPSGTDRAPQTPEELKAMDCNSVQEFWDNVLTPHTNDPSKWEKIATVPMRYNRLVLLDAKQWHDAGKSFGTDVTNGRLVYLTGYNASTG